MVSSVNVVASLRGRVTGWAHSTIVRDVVLPFIVVRVALIVVGVAASRVFPARPGLHAHGSPFVDALIRWDSTYYLTVAQQGYKGFGDAFFPLYPLLIRCVSVVLPIPYAAAFVAQAMALVAFGLLYTWVSDAYDRPTAKRSVEVALLFPTSFFIGAAYAESTYLVCLLAAFVAERRNKPTLALWAVFFACLARPQGFLVATVPFVLGWLAARRPRGRFPFFVLASVAALAVLCAIHKHASGDPLGFLHARTVQSLGVFREPPATAPAVFDVLWDEGFGTNLVRRMLNWSALTLVAIGTVVTLRSRRVAEAAVLVSTLAFPLYFHHTIFDAASMARYAAIAFPIYPLIAAATMDGERRRAFDLASSMLQVVLFAGFAGWYWLE